MPPPEYARLTIDFDLGADPIAGLVRSGRGHVQSFAGWMALTRAIELALDAARLGGQPPFGGAGTDGDSAGGGTEHSDAVIGPATQ
jgi:hypothetical protein